jgi:hypothetical protein
VIVFAPDTNSLHRVSAAGGASTPLPFDQRAKLRARWPWFLPDGRHFLYYAVTGPSAGTTDSIGVGSLDSNEVNTTLVEAPLGSLSSPAYAQGHVLFLRESTLMAQPFDAKRLSTTGEAVPLAENVQSIGNLRRGVFSVSENGLVAYKSGVGGGPFTLLRYDRSGKKIGNLGDPGVIGEINFSPDRKSLAVSITDVAGRSRDVWLYDVSRGLRTRFTFDPAAEFSPVWSPEGSSVVFSSTRKGHMDLYRHSSDGTGAEELLYADNLDKTPDSISPDGKFLLYHAADPKTSLDLWVLPLTPPGSESGRKPFPFAQTAFLEQQGQFSPDGRWVAYRSKRIREIRNLCRVLQWQRRRGGRQTTDLHIRRRTAPVEARRKGTLLCRAGRAIDGSRGERERRHP